MLTEKRLGFCFTVNYQKKLKQINYLTYFLKCPEEICSENHLGETGRRTTESVLDHAAKDKKFHMLRHTL